MKRLFRFRYPKIAGLVLAIIIAYIIFSNPTVQAFVNALNGWGYLGAFIAGTMFALGFTSPLAAGFFLVYNTNNLFLTAVVGGFGALLADMAIFKLIRFSFMDEFKRLRKTKMISGLNNLMEKSLGHRIRVYLLYALAGIFIASPLPDEAGIIMLAGLTRIKTSSLAIISFILNTVGIAVLLLI